MRARTIFLTGLALAVGRASAAPTPGFTLYSDVCYHRESGDILGTRIGILKLPEASYLYLQSAQGAFTPPQLIKLEPGDLKDGRLTFSTRILLKGPQSSFHGRVTDAALTGTFDNALPFDERRLNLRRISPDKKRFPDCK
jgi:hypothetical protein